MALSTSQQRENWRAFECDEPALKRTVFASCEVLVAPPTVEAWNALACVLATHGYKVRPADTSTYNCRQITGGGGKSLHSYGIALDINANTNPYKKTPDNRKVQFSRQSTQDQRASEVNLNRADTDFTPDMIEDVLAVKTKQGKDVFDWGGLWQTIKDPMHFQINVSPSDLETGIDWDTVKGADGVEPSNVAWDSGPTSTSVQAVPSGVTLGKFELVYPVVEKWEGNFDNDPDDPGGPTNMGITQADLARWRKQPVSVADVKNLTRDEARRIFEAFYWKPIDGDQLPLAASQMCYDAAVLMGLRSSGNFLQAALNQQGSNVAVDGNIGPKTIAACLAAPDLKKLVSDFSAGAEAYLRGRPGFAKYGKGWLNRENDVRATAMAMVSAAAATSVTTPESKTQVSPGVTKMAPDTDDLLAAIKQLIDQLQKTGGVVKAPPANDVTAMLQQVATVLQNLNIAPKSTAPSAPDQQQQTAQLQKIFDFVTGIINPSSQPQQLGQVNGALGQTIGNLLDGKKSATGIIGALLTSLLTQASSGSGGIGSTLTQIASVVPGLSGYAMPIFLALTAWGVLGKLEKWAQGTAPAPTSTK